MPQELEVKIINSLKAEPGQLARNLGDKLGVDKTVVNSLLYGKLKGKVRQDSKYRWYLVSNDVETDPSASAEIFANTDLAKLCRYYLACMGHDEAGISTFAHSKFGDPDYIELSSLPKNAKALEAEDGFKKMLGKVRADRSRQGLYLGYPASLKLIKSNRSDWEGFMVEPVLLFPINIDPSTGEPQLDLSYPIVNQKPLRSYTNADRDTLMDELVQLERELGIGSEDGTTDLDELALRLQSIRDEWPWKEDIKPNALNVKGKPLSELDEEGIYNRAIIIAAQKSPFTQGLETELRELAKLSPSALNGTALGSWLSNESKEADQTISENDKLIEVLPMNLEQRLAINSALSKPMTIITGPPGTGKSQVVTNLLINAAWQGKKVLFASKNNKAVDVVETRVNSLGARPILLRVGAQAYQTKLAEYLMAMLSATVSEDDKIQFEEASEIHSRLIAKTKQLDQETEELVSARNTTDALEQSVEETRKTISNGCFQSVKNEDISNWNHQVNAFRNVLRSADKEGQGQLIKLLWPLLKKSRFEAAAQRLPGVLSLCQKAEISSPDQFIDELNLPAWISFLNPLDERLDDLKVVKEYFTALARLQNSRPLEDISLERTNVFRDIARNSEALWKLWLRIQPSRISQSDRTMLNRYNSVLKMVMDAGTEGQLSKSVYKEYNSIFPKVSHLLPCWAVTSLSARGKIPFEPGFFDLVVFDEASQCDIASALPLLYRAKAAAVIGDPKQLSHISTLQRGQDQQLLEKYDLLPGFPHWAYSYNSLFDLAAGQATSENFVNLLDHHRSHADIIGFSNDQFYEGRLRVATKYDNLKRTAPKAPGVRWVDVKGSVRRPGSGGAVNETEAQAVVSALEDLVLKQGYKGSIGVVSPFRAQANAITAAVSRNDRLDKELQKHGFLSDTVHKFQGDERDIMIFSPVVSKGMPVGGLGFLRGNGNLFNVAITRARAQLVVVGDLSECSKCEVDYLSNFAIYTQKLIQEEQEVLEEQYGKDLGRSYPIVNNPEQVSDWERIFYSALYDAGIKTLPQYRIEKYALDLALLDGNRRLDIEVDGEKYHRNWTGELCRRDQIRNQRLYELGWDVMRFWVYEIRDDLPSCVDRVKRWLATS